MLRSLFALLFIAVFARYAVQSVFAAMLMYWWFGIFRPQEWMWWDVSSLRLPLLTAALFVGTALLRGYYPRTTHPVSILMVTFYCTALLATIGACVSYESVTIIYLSILMLVVLITERTLDSPKALWILMFVASASLAYYNADLAYDALLNSYSLYDRPIARGSFSDSNSSALGAAMGIFLQLFVIGAIGAGNKGLTPAILARRMPRLLTKLVLYALLIGSVIFVFKTESRGSALSMMLGFVVWTILHPKRFRITALWCVLLAIVLSVGVPEEYRDRLGSAFADSHELDHSAKSRPHYWDTAKRMAQRNAFGVGVGCYKERYNDYDDSGGVFGRYRSVHSSHYSVLAETGYPGFLAWIALLIATFITLFRVRGRAGRTRLIDPEQDFHFWMANALIAALAVFVTGGSFYELAYNDYTWLIFAMTIAMSRLQRKGGDVATATVGAASTDESIRQAGRGLWQ